MGLYSKFKTRFEDLGSGLCVGLDPDPQKLPQVLSGEAESLYIFCREIVDATAIYASAFKPNVAFFEASGSRGFQQFEKLIRHIKINHPEIPIVADCKRGDLANTAKQYAKYYFGELGVDSITASPYMGWDTVVPYLDYTDSFVFLLCFTSNPDSVQLQKQRLASNGRFVYEEVLQLAKNSGDDRIGFVVGGTHPEELASIRKLVPNRLFLIPGFGAQGASLTEAMHACGELSLLNSSRGIHFASVENDFAKAAEAAAGKIASEMRAYWKS